MQVYEDLHHVTNRPLRDEMEGIVHYLYGYRRGDDICSAVAWAQDAKDIMNDCDQTPIVCGGSGLYVRSLFSFIHDIPPISDEIRREVRLQMKSLGVQEMYQRLLRHHPHQGLKAHDSQRIARCWEVLLSTGEPLSTFHQKKTVISLWQGAPPFVIFLEKDRAQLKDSIAKRITDMMDKGALDEVRELKDKNYDETLPIMKAHGVPELMAHLAGDMTLEESLVAWRRATYRYARRQMTWARHQEPRPHFSGQDNVEDIMKCYKDYCQKLQKKA